MSRKDGLFDRTARSLMEVRKASYLKNPISSEMGVGQNELLTMIRVDSYEAIGKTFESVLESALEKGYPIDYAPTNTRWGKYNNARKTENVSTAKSELTTFLQVFSEQKSSMTNSTEDVYNYEL